MKIATTIAMYLLGIVFLVFGLNGFLGFIPMPEMSGDPAAFFAVMAGTGYLKVVKALEVIIGAMILLGVQRPLMYLLIAPITLNIVLFELLVAKTPGIGIALLLINAYLIYANRNRYQSIIA